jgi:hypothetical protein
MNCPTCRGKLPDPATNPDRPFCSARCKTIDLAKWLTGGFAIPGDPVDVEAFVESDAGQRGRTRGSEGSS